MVILLIPQRGSTVMTSTSPVFVLVPGAWHGGWAWQPVARRLREAGCAAVTITLPGLADGDKRGGLRLSDAVDHVVAEASHRDLSEVVLVGHSLARKSRADQTVSPGHHNLKLRRRRQ